MLHATVLQRGKDAELLLHHETGMARLPLNRVRVREHRSGGGALEILNEPNRQGRQSRRGVYWKLDRQELRRLKRLGVRLHSQGPAVQSAGWTRATIELPYGQKGDRILARGHLKGWLFIQTKAVGWVKADHVDTEWPPVLSKRPIHAPTGCHLPYDPPRKHKPTIAELKAIGDRVLEAVPELADYTDASKPLPADVGRRLRATIAGEGGRREGDQDRQS